MSLLLYTFIKLSYIKQIYYKSKAAKQNNLSILDIKLIIEEINKFVIICLLYKLSYNRRFPLFYFFGNLLQNMSKAKQLLLNLQLGLFIGSQIQRYFVGVTQQVLLYYYNKYITNIKIISHMGGCVPTYKKRNVKKKLYQTVPYNINQFDPQAQHKYEFQATLANVKIQDINKKLNNPECAIHFEIPGFFEATCPYLKCKANKIKWNISIKKIITFNDFELRANFLNITIMDSQKHPIHNININIFRIANGPFHHNFKIVKKNKNVGRLIFDFKITQIVPIKLQCLSHQINFLKQYLGEKYSFLLDFYSHNSASSQRQKIKGKTQQSYICETPLNIKEKYRQVESTDQAPSPTLRQKRTESKLIKSQGFTIIKWEQGQGNSMPSFTLKVKISDLMSETFNIRVFNHANQKNSKQFGNCTIILSQIINENILYNGRKSQEYSQSSNIETIQKNLWRKGNKIGKSRLTIKITTSLIFKQMYGETQTEEDIIHMSHLEQFSVQKKQLDDQFFNTLRLIQKNLINIKQKNKNQLNKYEYSSKNKSLIAQMIKMKQILLQNNRSSASYISDNVTKNQKQITLTNIIKLLCLEIGQQNVQLNKICWENVMIVLKRPELKLKYWEFSNEEYQRIQQGECNLQQQTINKIYLCTQFYAIQCALLKSALDTHYLALEQQNQSAEEFKSFCFFKVPIFRQKLIQKISMSSSNDGLDLFIQEIIQNVRPYQDKIGENMFTIIDNSTRVYKIICATQKGKQINQDLYQFLASHQWVQQFSDKDQIFYDFTRYVMKKYLSARQLTNNLGYFPGYTFLAAAFIQSMRKTEILNYSTSLILCATQLIENYRLILPIIKIMYSKTNNYNVTEVQKLMTILFHFLHRIPKATYQNPTYFPYKYFMQGIKQILQGETTLNIGQSLILLYNNYQNFHVSFRFQVSMYLLGAILWKLMYNWSFNIRRFIAHIIILRICQDTQLLTTTNIQVRVNQVMKILVNGEKIWKCYHVKNLVNKDKILHKKMRDKISSKLRYQENTKIIRLNSLSNSKNKNLYNVKNIQKVSYQDFTKNIVQQEQKIKIINYNDKNRRYSQSTNSSQQNIKHRHLKPKSSIYDIISQQSQSPDKYSRGSPQKSSRIPLSQQFSQLRNKKSLSFFVKPVLPFTPKYFKSQQLIITQQIPAQAYKYLNVACKQLRQILKLVDEHYAKTQSVPAVNLGLMIQVDEKQILPSQEDFSLIF